MLNYNLNINSPLQQEKKNEDVRPEIYWDYSYSSSIKRQPAPITFVSSSYATMSISAQGTNAINIISTNNNNFTTDGQAPVTASLTGSNWPTTGSVTMSITVAGITYDPLSTNTFFSASFSSSATIYNANPSITGSIITSSFIASEFYRYYVSASLVHNYNTPLPTGGLIQRLDAFNLTSYPGSGSIWYDISGYNHHMSASFGATFPTYDDNEFIFDGLSDTIGAYITSSLTAYTFVVWTKVGTLTPATASTDSGGAYGISSGSIGDAPLFGIRQFDSLTFGESQGLGSNTKWEIATENNNRDVLSSVTETNTNEYLMISMTKGIGGAQKLYRNEILVGTGSLGENYAASAKNLILIGNRYYIDTGSIQGYAPEGFYSGSIQAAFLYNRELSADEITDVWNADLGQ